jgi:hypothetical protein
MVKCRAWLLGPRWRADSSATLYRPRPHAGSREKPVCGLFTRLRLHEVALAASADACDVLNALGT